ncbi:MAG: glutamate--tRNA ligase [Candidatus Paceibacterota bacterium]
MNPEKVVTRFAPSPTGFLHIGGVRTALFNYLFAKQNKGEFVLRIEDTDKERNKEEWTEGLIKDLDWLGLKHDRFETQSKRFEIHKKYLQKLIDDGYAYISKETPTEVGQREEVIRFRNPNKIVIFEDLIRGTVSVDTSDLNDFVIARSLEEPLYHLAVVIDDFEMGITHVIRGEEHLSNTPRQILIQEAIGAPRPIYAHMPLVLATDRSKLSKRIHGETVSLTYYREQGYLPEAILNFVVMIGWNSGTDQEIFSMDELIEQFKIEKVQKGGGVLNVEKLDWINKEYIKKLSDEEILEQIYKYLSKDFTANKGIEKLAPIVRERIFKFSDIKKFYNEGEFSYYFERPTVEKANLICPEKLRKGKEVTEEEVKNNLEKIFEFLSTMDETDFSAEKIKTAVWDFATTAGRGVVLWAFRYALSGKERSPDPFVLSEFLGKKETLERLSVAIR